MGLRSRSKKLYPGTWDIIGGHCELGETPDQALIREFGEELGVTPIEFEQIAELSESNPTEHGRYKHHVYVIRSWSGKPENLSDEHEAIRWLTARELHGLGMASDEYPSLFEPFLEGYI